VTQLPLVMQPVVRPRLRLLPDRRPSLVARRRDDCAQLTACEDAWIAAHDGEQARCPVHCDAYEMREGVDVTDLPEGTPRLAAIGKDPERRCTICGKPCPPPLEGPGRRARVCSEFCRKLRESRRMKARHDNKMRAAKRAQDQAATAAQGPASSAASRSTASRPPSSATRRASTS